MGSVDGLICAVDTSMADVDEAFIDALNVDDSISKFGFFGGSQQFIYCSTTSEKASVWNVAEAKLIKDYGDLRTSIDGLSADYLIDWFFDSDANMLFSFLGTYKGEMVGNIVSDKGFTPKIGFETKHT